MGTGSDRDSACPALSVYFEANLDLSLNSITPGLARIFRHKGV
jgi:hypothetical protein